MPLDSLLSLLENAQLIRHLIETEPTYMFKHALVQQAAYQSLLVKSRREIHRQVAESYEMLYLERLDQHAAVLAQHYAEAGDNAKTVEYDQLAGDTSARFYANAEALMHYSHAIDIAAKNRGLIDTDKLTQLYLSRGRVYELTGRFKDAATNYAEMHKLAQDLGDRPMELAALIALAIIHATPTVIHDVDQARALSNQALAVAYELGDRQAECRILWNLLNLEYFKNRYEESIQSGEKALTIARELGLQEQTASILNDISRVYLGSGLVSRAKLAVNEARDLWSKLDNLPMLADNYATAAEISQYAADYDDSIALAARAVELGKSIENPWVQSYGLWSHAVIAFERGEVDRAISMMMDALDYGRKAGLIAVMLAGSIDLGFFYAQFGMYDKAIETIESSQRDNESSFHSFFAWANGTLSRVFARKGDLGAAERMLERAETTFQSREYRLYLTAPVMMARAELAIAREQFSQAIDAANSLIERYDATGITQFLTDAMLVKGKALARRGDLQTSFETLSRVLEIAERLKSRRVLWQILLELSNVEDQRGNAARAEDMSTKAVGVIDFIVQHIRDANLRKSFIALTRAQMDSIHRIFL